MPRYTFKAMARLPLELALTLRQGTVYKMAHRHVTSELPHFMVVLNQNPQTDTVLVLGVFSSQVESTRMRCRLFPKETVVVVTPEEYNELTVESVIDCNSVKELPLSDLVQKFITRDLQNCTDLPAVVVGRIVVGDEVSPMVSPRLKKSLK